MDQDLNPVRSEKNMTSELAKTTASDIQSILDRVEVASNGVNQRLTALEEKIEKIWASVEKTRKMYLWSLIIGAVLLILPLIAMGFVIPQYLKSIDIQSLFQ